MRPFLSRRLLLGGLAGAALSSSRMSWADAAEHMIAVGTWGGAYARALHELVGMPLLRNDHLGVRQVIADEQARVAHIMTPTANPHLDVALLSDTDAYRLSLRQIFTPVTTDGVRSLPRIASGKRAPYGVPQSQTALCIAYNESKLSRPPRSFEDLFEAAKQGHVGFSDELAIHNLAAAAIAQRRAAASMETARSTFLALKRSGKLRLYPTNEALGTALDSGEIIMAPMWRSRAYQWREAGRDVGNVVPFEGAIPFTIYACVPKGGHQTQSAMLYLEQLLHSDVQVSMAKRLGLLPTVIDARIDESLLRRIGFTAQERAQFRPLSLSSVAQHGLALRQFWDQALA